MSFAWYDHELKKLAKTVTNFTQSTSKNLIHHPIITSPKHEPSLKTKKKTHFRLLQLFLEARKRLARNGMLVMALNSRAYSWLSLGGVQAAFRLDQVPIHLMNFFVKLQSTIM